MSIRPRKALVTGGAGFIGSHLVDRLLAEGWIVTVIDDLSSGDLAYLPNSTKELTFIEGSITDSRIVERALSNVSHVFHLAARPSVAHSIENPFETNEVNVSGTLRLLELSRRCKNIERFVMTSSSSVYGNMPPLLKTEPMAGNPLSPYALQKWTGEYYLKLFYDLYQFPGITLRPFNVFGPRQRSDHPYAAVIPNFVNNARAGTPLIIYGDGHQTRDFTYVSNMVEGFLLAGTTKNLEALGKAFNIGNSERTSVLDLAHHIIRLTRSPSQCEHRSERVGDIRDSYASIESASRVLHYSPQLSFLEGLKKLIQEEAQAGF